MGGWARRRGRIAAVLGVCAVGVGALTLEVTGADESDEPLGIEVLDVAIDDGQVAAAVEIENRDAVRHELEVFLTLGVYGTDNAWDRRVAEISQQEMAVRSGDTSLVVWDEPVAVPAGDYEVSVWVKMTSAAGDPVVHQVGADSVSTDEATTARVRPTGEGPRLTDLGLELTSGEILAIDGTVAMEGLSGDASLKLDLVPAIGADAWWVRAATRSLVMDVDPDGSGDAELEIDELVPAAPGDYMVRAELRTDDVLHDQVLLADTVTVEPVDRSIRRSETPVGAVAIMAATTETTWTAAEDAIVEVDVQNLSNEPVDGQFWWVLAAPGEPEPWRFAEAESYEVQRRLQPHERRTIRLALDGEINVGRGFELSVWSHVLDDAGSSHSDGVRVSQLIDTDDTTNGASQ